MKSSRRQIAWFGADLDTTGAVRESAKSTQLIIIEDKCPYKTLPS